jgi:hypothetical protein
MHFPLTQLDLPLNSQCMTDLQKGIKYKANVFVPCGSIACSDDIQMVPSSSIPGYFCKVTGWILQSEI